MMMMTGSEVQPASSRRWRNISRMRKRLVEVEKRHRRQRQLEMIAPLSAEPETDQPKVFNPVPGRGREGEFRL